MARRMLPLLAALLLAPTQALAAPAHAEAPEPPPLPAEGEVPEPEFEPEVTIIQKRDATIEEYRIRGRLVAARVIPKRGAPYYLVDADGDGNLETRRSELGPDFLVPGWILKRW